MATQLSRRTSAIWDATPAVRDEARIREFTQRSAWKEGVRFDDANVRDGGLRLHVARPDTVSYAPGSMAALPKAMKLREIRG